MKKLRNYLLFISCLILTILLAGCTLLNPEEGGKTKPEKEYATINLYSEYGELEKTKYQVEVGLSFTFPVLEHDGYLFQGWGEEGKDGYIVIGIDAPKTDISRTLEMTPDSLIFKRKIKIDRSGYASKLGNFIFEVVKPDIDNTFFTKSEKEFTGIGGSSMGGIAAFYLGIEHLNEVGYCLNFSPAFFLYTWKSFKDYLDANISRKLPKMFFYVGGNGFEKLFVEDTIKTFNYFLKHGYSHDEVKLLYVSHEEHNEKAWREYFPFAMTQIDK